MSLDVQKNIQYLAIISIWPSACRGVLEGRKEAAESLCLLWRCCPGWAGPSPGAPVALTCHTAGCSGAGSSSAISEWCRCPYWPQTSLQCPWIVSTAQQQCKDYSGTLTWYLLPFMLMIKNLCCFICYKNKPKHSSLVKHLPLKLIWNIF